MQQRNILLCREYELDRYTKYHQVPAAKVSTTQFLMLDTTRVNLGGSYCFAYILPSLPMERDVARWHVTTAMGRLMSSWIPYGRVLNQLEIHELGVTWKQRAKCLEMGFFKGREGCKKVRTISDIVVELSHQQGATTCWTAPRPS